MDVVVTVPKARWADWLAEGDLPGSDQVGCPDCGWAGPRADWPGALHARRCPRILVGPPEWRFYTRGGVPDMAVGDRVYIVAFGRLRGYAPLVRAERAAYGVNLVRGAGAVAVTIPERVAGFRGWRYRWWDRDQEVPFPGWQQEGVDAKDLARGGRGAGGLAEDPA